MKKIIFILLLFTSLKSFSQSTYCLPPAYNSCTDSTTQADSDLVHNVYIGASMLGVQNWGFDLIASLPHWIAYYVKYYGSGSVTSITPGFGFTSSTPITTSGTLNIDSNKMATKSYVISHEPTDSIHIFLSPLYEKINLFVSTVGLIQKKVKIDSLTTANTGIAQGNGSTVSLSTALANGTTATTQAVNDASTDIATDQYAEAVSPKIEAYQALGSVIQDQTLNCDIGQITSSIGPTSGNEYWFAIWIPKAQTITGVKWQQITQGSYTASHYNGVALYSYSGGTLTLVDSSTRSATIFEGASGMQSKAFSSTYSASRGIYFIALIYSQSAVSTAPTFGDNALATQNSVQSADFTNSAALGMYVTGATSLKTTQACSGTTITMANLWLSLY